MVSQKAEVKTELVEQPAVPEPVEASVEIGDKEVVKEISVVLLRPRNVSTDRLIFQQPHLQQMNDCRGRVKTQVKYLELTYDAHAACSEDEKAALYDGVYNGESLTKGDPLLRNAVAFFRSNRLYLMPLEHSYELRRRIDRAKQPKNPIELNRLEDSKLFDEPPGANPIRVSFARPETDWQKKRREKSAQYREQLFESDPWSNFTVKKSSVRRVFPSL